MKRILVAVVFCILIAPMGFAQTSSHRMHRKAARAERVTVTGTFAGIEEGSATAYQPANTLVVRVNDATPERYVLRGRGRIVDKYGRLIDTPIQPGTHVHVVYMDMGDVRVVDQVVVED
jgi:hypothetical protein